MRRSLRTLTAACLAVSAVAPAAGAQNAPQPQPQPAPGTPFGPVSPATPPAQETETEPAEVGRPEEDGLEGVQMLAMLGIAIALIGGVAVMIARDGRARRAGSGKKPKRIRGTGRASASRPTGAAPGKRPPGGPPPPPRKKSKARAKAKRR